MSVLKFISGFEVGFYVEDACSLEAFPFVSRNSTESPSCPNVNVRLGWCLFKSVLNLSKDALVSVQTTNTSSK